MAADAARPPGAPAYRPGERRRARSEPLSHAETGFCLALPLLLFAAHLTFGAARLEASLVYTALYGLFATALMAAAWARRGLGRIRGLGLLAGCAVVTAAVLAWPLTPFVPGGPHPVWSYVEASPAGAVDKSGVFVELLKLGGLACVFLAALALSASGRRARLLFNAILVLAALYAAWAVAAHLLDPRFILGVGKRYAIDRLTGSFFSANSAGTLMGSFSVLLAAALFHRLRGERTVELKIRRGAPLAAAATIVVIALLLTASRGAIAATAVAVVVLLLVEVFGGTWRWRLGAAVVGAAVSVALAPLVQRAGDHAATRYAVAGDDLGMRLQMFEAHWAAIRAAPWTGYGLGGFDTVNQLIMTPANYDALWSIHALHNIYLQWLEEAGALGAAAMFVTLAVVLGPIAMTALRERQPVAVGVILASLVMLTHGLTDYALQVPSIQAFWACLLGLGYGQARTRSR
jgi:O-antigen ligase